MWSIGLVCVLFRLFWCLWAECAFECMVFLIYVVFLWGWFVGFGCCCWVERIIFFS